MDWLNTRFEIVGTVRNSVTVLSSLCGANIMADPLHCYKAQMFNLVLIRLFMNSNLYMSVVLRILNEIVPRRSEKVTCCPSRHTQLPNMDSMLIQRHDVESTLNQCCVNFVCLLGLYRSTAYRVSLITGWITVGIKKKLNNQHCGIKEIDQSAQGPRGS